MINQIIVLDNNVISCVQIEMGATPSRDWQTFVVRFLTKVISDVAIISILVIDFLI